MRLVRRVARRLGGAFLVCATPLAAQRSPTPALQPLRVAGELAAGTVGFTLGAETGLVTGAGIAYLVRGHGGDITTPGLMRMTWTVLVLGGGVGAGTSTWLVSRIDHQTSSLGWDVGAATAATAVAFAWAEWPMTKDRSRRKFSRFRTMTPVWAGALAATIAANATRERR